VSAVGGLVASLSVATAAGSPRALAVYTAAGVLTGVSLVLTGLAPNFLLLLAASFLFGFAVGVFMTLNGAVIVLETAEAFYGRVISLTSLAFAGFMLAGLPVGIAADVLGERVTLVALGALVLGSVAAIAPLIARAPSTAPEGAAAVAAAGR
jgi:predicted MFS family arabinose efflux permease